MFHKWVCRTLWMTADQRFSFLWWRDRYVHTAGWLRTCKGLWEEKTRFVLSFHDESGEECISTKPCTPAHQIRLNWEEFCAWWISMGHCHEDNKPSILCLGEDLNSKLFLEKQSDVTKFIDPPVWKAIDTSYL